MRWLALVVSIAGCVAQSNDPPSRSCEEPVLCADVRAWVDEDDGWSVTPQRGYTDYTWADDDSDAVVSYGCTDGARWTRYVSDTRVGMGWFDATTGRLTGGCEDQE